MWSVYAPMVALTVEADVRHDVIIAAKCSACNING